MITGPSVRRKIYIVLRLVVLLYVAVVLARFVNSREYASFYSKVLLRIHTDLKTSQKVNQLPSAIASLLENSGTAQLQELLDQYYSIFALVITDCRTQQSVCPGQKVLFATSQHLLSRKLPGPEELPEYPYIVLLRPEVAQPGDKGSAAVRRQREIIGRLYTISTIPTSFAADYRAWLKDPLADYGPWKHYLTNMVNCLLGAILTWLVVELFLKLRGAVALQEGSDGRRQLVDLLGGFQVGMDAQEHLAVEAGVFPAVDEPRQHHCHVEQHDKPEDDIDFSPDRWPRDHASFRLSIPGSLPFPSPADPSAPRGRLPPGPSPGWPPQCPGRNAGSPRRPGRSCGCSPSALRRHP